MAGEGQEHLVQAGLAELELGDADVGASQLGQGRGGPLGVVDPRRERRRVGFEVHLDAEREVQHLLGFSTLTRVDQAHVQGPRADGGLELGAGPLGQFVLGGAVRPGIYGRFPELALGGPDDANNRGVWIPTISTSQFGATLGKWFGASPAELAVTFPNLGNFGGVTDIGFMF